jgi:hypothetical protein
LNDHCLFLHITLWLFLWSFSVYWNSKFIIICFFAWFCLINF